MVSHMLCSLYEGNFKIPYLVDYVLPKLSFYFRYTVLLKIFT